MTDRTSHRRPSGAIRRLPSGRWQALTHEVSTMARGGWRDPRRGEQPLGEQVLDTWIDAPVPEAAAAERPRTVHLGIRTLASPTPAVVREWNQAVTAESTWRVTEWGERNGKHDVRVNAAIRASAAASGATVQRRVGGTASSGGQAPPGRSTRGRG